MAVLIDTTVLIDAERRGDRLDQAVGDEERGISVISASELLHGVHRAADEGARARRQVFVEHVLAALDPLPITTRIARAHARLWADLERGGAVIGSHDMWIAATALAHGMSVATANTRHFERVAGLSVVAV